MADDQGYADVGCYGSEHIRTPHIDKMAAEGMRFTDCYSGSAVCAPTRCVLMTGLHPGHCRRRDNTATGNLESFGKERPLVFLEAGDVTVAEKLKEAGYATGGFGKWGLGNPGSAGVPEKQGFDLWFGYYDQVHAHTYYTDHLIRNSEKVPLDGKTYSHTPIMAEAFGFIEKHARAERPFFAYLAICPPHGKYVVPGQGIYTDEPWSEVDKNYAAMCTLIDTNVGELFKLLARLGIDENTIVFYTSDNGPNRQFLERFASNKPFRGIKRQLTEGGLRCPMVVRWPGTIGNGVTSGFAWTHKDFLATACELAGVDPPARTDSVSVLPVLTGRKQEALRNLYWEIHHPFQQAVRMGKWKGLRFGTKEPLQLYDLDADPSEANDLAAQHPGVVKRIEAIMAREHTPSPFYPAVEKARKKRRGKKAA
ncbi:MAG: arylsulfatase [Akkermansiaceae bacterium]|nr:arylsulfatase [Akkermansiaceae bacterium]